jgi:hypothetical protein
MNIMKQFICIIAGMLTISLNLKAQATMEIKIEAFKATIEKNNLLVNWISDTKDQDNYWAVQASADGKTFSTIGMVMGADPAAAGTYTFKQDRKKIKPGFRYYRVLHVEPNDQAVASNTIGLTK